ncbi:uncharacterized protein PAC_11560 [Phialocephala subalpina]|uniref:DUF7582 domain-containing protein n=1 Tax=Phialocephala subalpina TaxID=576137 RepID=A0A1L7X9F8_9HELO|nr:uncharacterized protein PAC_11560 [Phialocephala subalpina]
MPITKECISPPIEAGPSLLDTKQLPPQVTDALDYVSGKLARKRLHLSLIVVRKDVQIPSLPSPQSPKRAESPPHSITTSPARSLFSPTTFKRSRSKSSISSMSDTTVSSTISVSSSASLSRTNWPSLPASPKDFTATPPPPPTPGLSQSSTPISPNPYGITLLHASSLTAKAEKILRHTVAKAEKKFSIGSGWLSSQSLSESHPCPSTNDLIHRSLTQNEILFSSEGLTLLSLDHVYTFKCQLHTYSRTLSPTDLTSAVDELRRLVLAQHGRRITKGYLMRAYDWLGISLAALVDVNEGYKVAYGGKERFGGIEVQNEERQSPPPLKTNFEMKEIRRMRIKVGFGDRSPSTSSNCGSESGDEAIQVGESAKGKDTLPVEEELREDRGPHRRGPTTPNGFEDITPVTKGEWCFLMVGDGWKDAKTAAVETC